MDMQSQKVVPTEFSPSASSKKYQFEETSRTESGKILSRKNSFSNASQGATYVQLSDVYLDPWKVRYADAGIEKALKAGQRPVENPWVKRMEVTFAMKNAQRYRGLMKKFGVMILMALLGFAFLDYKRIVDEGSTSKRVTVLALKLGFMMPMMILWVAFSYSSYFIEKSYFIELILAMGQIVVVLWGQTRDSGTQYEKDIRAFVCFCYILFCFMFTNCRLMAAFIINMCAVVTFAIWTATEPSNSFQDSATYTTLLVLGVAVAGYTSYNQETLARKFHLQKACRKMQSAMLKREQEQSNKLLASMLPADVLSELQMKGQFGDDGTIAGDNTIAKDFPDVTVLFCMVNDFGDITAQLPAHLVVTVLNAIYMEFDKMVDEHEKVYKVETVGEVYLCATGIPRTSNTHAAEAADYALAMLECMPVVRTNVVEALRAEGIENCDELGTGGSRQLEIKVGLDSGPLVTGVIGKKGPRYKMFGDVVNTASRMESKSIPGRIQVSPSAWARLTRIPKVTYKLEKRTPAIEFKGKGVMQTYFLSGKEVTGAHRITKAIKKEKIASVKAKTQSLTFGKVKSQTTPGAVPDEDEEELCPEEEDEENISDWQRKQRQMREIQRAADRFVDRMAEQEAAKEQMAASVTGTDKDVIYRNKKAIDKEQQKLRRRSMGVSNSDNTAGGFEMAAEQVIQKVHKRHQQQARAERWRALQVFKQLKKVDRTTLPLAQQLWLLFGNKTVNGGSEPCQQNEALYVAVHFPADSSFIRYSALAWLCLQCIFIFFDWVVYVEGADDVDAMKDRAFVAWVAVAPCVLLVLGLSFHGFRESSLDTGKFEEEDRRNKMSSRKIDAAHRIASEQSSADERLHCSHRIWFKQRMILTVLFTWATGLGFIAQTLVSGEPKYMLVAFFIVWQYNVNNTLLPLYISILTAIVHSVAYVAAAAVMTDMKGDLLMMHGLFLVTVTFFMAFPAFESAVNARVIHNNRVLMDASHLLLAKEQMRGTALLHSLLPKSVVERFKAGQQLIADHFPQASVLFTDMKGFTKFTSTVTPTELVTFLNQMFSSFDVIGTEHELYKVEIIGDAYYAVAGCPNPRGDHAYCAVIACLKFLWDLPKIRAKCGDFINIRIGIHTGPVVAGVVGLKDPRYHLFGDTVKLAEDMESHGIPGRLQISEETYKSLHSKDAMHGKPMGGHGGVSDFDFIDRGIIPVKGRGPIHTYMVGPSATLRRRRNEEGFPIPDMTTIEENMDYISPEDLKKMEEEKAKAAEDAVKKSDASKGGVSGLEAEAYVSATSAAHTQSQQYADSTSGATVSHTPVDQIQLSMAGVELESTLGGNAAAIAAAGGGKNHSYSSGAEANTRSLSQQRKSLQTGDGSSTTVLNVDARELLDDNRKLASILHDTEIERDMTMSQMRALQAQRVRDEEELHRTRDLLRNVTGQSGGASSPQANSSLSLTVRSVGQATQDFGAALPPLGASLALGRPRTAGSPSGKGRTPSKGTKGGITDTFEVAGQTSSSGKYGETLYRESSSLATGRKLQALLEVVSPKAVEESKAGQIKGPSVGMVPNRVEVGSVPQLLSLSEVRKLQRLRRQVQQPFLSLLLHNTSNVPAETSALVQRLEGDDAVATAASTISTLQKSFINSDNTSSGDNAEDGYGTAVSEYAGWWGLDIFEVDDWSQQGALQFLSHCVFTSYDFFFEGPRGLGLSRQLLVPFLDAIECGYNLCHNQSLGGERNPYHNSLHAATVLTDVHFFLRQGQLLLLPGMQQWEVLAMIFAALVHDYRHPATSNNFEAATLSERAMIYNDISVLENYHLSESFKVTRDPAFAIFEGMEMTTYQQMRGMVVELVLATDLKQHFAILASAREAFGRVDRDQTFSSRMLLTLAFKASDVAHAAKNADLHKQWSDRIMSEFFLQGDRERSLGLKISPFMDSRKQQIGKCQTGFIDFLCAPLYQLLAQAMGDHLGERGIGSSKGLCSPAQLQELSKQADKENEQWAPTALPLCMAPVMTNMRRNRAMWAKIQAEEEEIARLKAADNNVISPET